ncbi:hypothetical protein [Lutimonas sp.]|uniref:hypothetical protein n=1 Tax=Lutimonas sp. TaxID=1872403 RepID=UPI003C72962B
MKNLFFLLAFYMGVVYTTKGQEIIPFPDLSESHIAVYNQVDLIDSHNYSLYTKDYQDSLHKIDRDIETVNSEIEKESNKAQITSLESKKAELIKKRNLLLKEAELLEDLNKFY